MITPVFTNTQLPVPNSTSGQLLANGQAVEGGQTVQRQITCLGDPTLPGANGGVMRVNYGAAVTDGGTDTVPIAAAASSDTVVKATPGRLCKVLVTTLGTNAMAIWDNASGHTGTIIGQLPASAAVGTIFSFQLPAANGITVQGNGSNPAVTISFI